MEIQEILRNNIHIISECIMFVIFLVATLRSNSENGEIKYYVPTDTSPRILFLIITMPNSTIPLNMSRFYVNDLNQKSGYKALYLDWKKTNKTEQDNKDDILHLAVPERYRNITSNITTNGSYNKKSVDIFRKTYFGLSYFYYETNYRWLHRTTDDTGINLKRLDSFYDAIEKKYDPLKDVVIKGCCIRHIDYLGFLQGGAGYFYSRRAVELMLPMYEEIIFNCKRAEDVCHDEFIFRLNLSMKNATSYAFSGHPFPKSDLDRIKKNDFNDLKQCPEEQHPTRHDQCPMYHCPINKLVFLHHHDVRKIPGVIMRNKQIFAVEDETIHFYYADSTHPELCKAKNKTYSEICNG
ncbi:hypothetical protein GPJ56_004378 [Histomonas meleagridis]|uniref:uncharacterized protein n=1 Tax=Histomonas meleagridis TaxID=135588 RepID=UPI0035595509|nr:hypothetical protein GPJ56_004378 [Histomonas meleagridis]KAH0799977.1 hypothetical protein GO595_007089 [Histomonas meleagridis]